MIRSQLPVLKAISLKDDLRAEIDNIDYVPNVRTGTKKGTGYRWRWGGMKRMKYLVVSPGEREITVEAPNSTKAKQLACKFWGIKPSDEWCGVSVLKVTKIKEG